jgi:sensor c-di-GMP phosphodiesterase-like protein
MSEILDLARSFEQKSKQQARNTEQVLQTEFERHERFISEALNSSEQTISAAISAHNQRLSALALKGWLWIALSLFLVLSASAGVLWWTGERIAANLTEIERQGRTLEQLEAHTFGVQLIEDKSGRFIVLPKGRKVADGWTVGDKPALKLIEE